MQVCRLTGSRHGFELVLRYPYITDEDTNTWFLHVFSRHGDQIKAQIYWANTVHNMVCPSPDLLVAHLRGLPVEILSFEFPINLELIDTEDHIETEVHKTEGLAKYSLENEYREHLIQKYIDNMKQEYDTLQIDVPTSE